MWVISRMRMRTVTLVRFVQKLAEGSFGVAEVYIARFLNSPEEFPVVVKKSKKAKNKKLVEEFSLHKQIYDKLQKYNSKCKKYIPEPFHIKSNSLSSIDDAMYAMEYVDAPPLKANEYHKATHATQVIVIEEIRKALRCLHSVGCVHNDAHPGNFVVSLKGRSKPVVKLLDFGMARCGFEPYRGSTDRQYARWLTRVHKTTLKNAENACRHTKDKRKLCLKPDGMWMAAATRRGRLERACKHGNYLACPGNPTANSDYDDFHEEIGQILRRVQPSLRSRSRSIGAQTSISSGYSPTSSSYSPRPPPPASQAKKRAKRSPVRPVGQPKRRRVSPTSPSYRPVGQPKPRSPSYRPVGQPKRSQMSISPSRRPIIRIPAHMVGERPIIRFPAHMVGKRPIIKFPAKMLDKSEGSLLGSLESLARYPAAQPGTSSSSLLGSLESLARYPGARL